MSAKSRELRIRRHKRLRRKLSGTSERPRLAVFRSLNHIYAQVIDNVECKTLASASTIDKKLSADLSSLNKKDQAAAIGKAVAERAKAAGVEEVVFDRGGFNYTGRIQALADGAREAGLKF